MKRFIVLVTIIGAAVVCFWVSHAGKSAGERGARVPSKDTVEMPSTAVATTPIKIHLFGTVRITGDFLLSKPSLAEALSRGTPYVLSDLKKVRIYRLKSGIRVKDQIVDASRVFEPGAPDVYLEDGDTIFVPEKII